MLKQGLFTKEYMLASVLLMTVMAISTSVIAADVFEGKKLYSRYCEGCHGQDGHGVLASVPDFTFGEGLMQSDFDLFAGISEGKGVMPAYRGLLDKQEILNVIAYIRTFY